MRLNYRYAPDRDARRGRGAPARARRRPSVEITSQLAARACRRRLAARRSGCARPAASRSSRSRPGRRSPSSPAQGLDAVNFGPGATRYAHSRDERVEIAELERTLRGAAARSCRASVRPCTSRPFSPPRAPIRSSGSTRRSARPPRRGIELIDFGMGDPREPTEPLIRQALVDGLRGADGLSEGARACRSCARRSPAGASGASASQLDPDARDRSRPTARKEAIFSFAQVVVDPSGRRTPSSSPSPATRCPSAARRSRARGSSAAAARGERLPARPRRGRTRLGPRSRSSGSTTRTTRRARSRRSRSTSGWPSSPREHGFLVASDEAYSELWFDEPPRSALAARRPRATSSSSTRSPSARR